MKRRKLFLGFADGFDDAASGGDGLENGFENLAGLCLVAAELHVALVVGNGFGEKGWQWWPASQTD